MDNPSNAPRSETTTDRILASLMTGPKHPRNAFLVGECTCEQLYRKANAVRYQMRRLPDKITPLCLCTENRDLMAAALLASLMEGVPLLIPYAFDVNTLREALNRKPYTHVLMDKDLQLPAGVTGLQWPQAADRPARDAQRKPMAWDELWLYLFTGGSTGTPQIWSKTPCNLLNEADNLANTFNITRTDTIVATVPTNHIYGLLYSILLPLVSGAGVSAKTPLFPLEIADCLKDARATVLVSIPAHYRALKETPIAHHNVRLAFSSAGALPEQDAADFFNASGIAITEIYGSTETGGIAQRTRAEGQTALYPFECANVRIEEQHLQVRSPFLSNELPKSGDGFFETSDRAQWSDPPGFSLLGRTDGIVKVGGKRVDLAVTKEALMAVKGVRDVYVYTQAVQSGRENEILALVEGDATTDQLTEAANRQLPPYARPRGIKVTRQMPVTSTGKYRRSAIETFFKPDD